MSVIVFRRIFCFSMLLCLVEMWACSSKIDPSKLAGTYEARFGNGHEILELRSNGTYMQRFIAVDGTESTYSNSWKFESLKDEPKVALQGFASHFGQSPKADVVLLGVHISWGRIRLYQSYPLDQYYVRTESN